MVGVIVKWSGKSFPVNCDLNADPNEFFKAIESATGIPASRQKVMLKGKLLKNTWDGFKINESSTFLLMGQKEEIISAPIPVAESNEQTEVVAHKQIISPIGITNLGNTCYLNSTLQCLLSMSELSDMLKAGNHSLPLIKSWSSLAKTADHSDHPPHDPLMFLVALRAAYPQFSEADARGFKQQDAEEAWTALVNTLQSTSSTESFVKKYMTLEIYSELKCDESEEEPASINLEPFNRLSVHIGAGVTTHMVSDIQSSLEEKIEKTSPVLNRMAVYTKKSSIQRLPKYLAMHFIRFQWKPSERIKAKILKNVKFPLELDATQFCTPELKVKCGPVKAHLSKYEEIISSLKKQKNFDPSVLLSNKSEKEILETLNVDSSLLSDEGCNPSGVYELCGVLTHMGRTADSGHYISWVRYPDSDVWWKCDDDKISAVSDDEVLKLGGGGDWHSAYICLYRAKSIKEIPIIE